MDWLMIAVLDRDCSKLLVVERRTLLLRVVMILLVLTELGQELGPELELGFGLELKPGSEVKLGLVGLSELGVELRLLVDSMGKLEAENELQVDLMVFVERVMRVLHVDREGKLGRQVEYALQTRRQVLVKQLLQALK